MKSFREFVEEDVHAEIEFSDQNGSGDAAVALLSSGNAAAGEAVAVGLVPHGVPRTRRVARAVLKLVFDPEVLEAVSTELGPPREGETEDEYIARARPIVRTVVDKFFK